MDELDKYYDISLNENEINKLIKNQDKLSQKITSKYELDNIEKTICWISGLSAGLVDAFLVTNYKNLNTDNITKLNGKLNQSGKINEIVDNRIKNIFSAKEINELEGRFKVPYDASTSVGLDKYILGLNPRTHRIQSLGHDPILGFYYGVRDILNGEFTAIDNAGDVIKQVVSGQTTSGMNIFKAIATQFGHLCSDISTPAGLPIPFMSQLLKLKGGDIEGFSYNRLIKNMYAKGYNFNHLLTMAVPALIIEIVTRLSYFIYSLSKGMSFKESIPINKVKLDKMLFNSYLIATGCNGVKLIATHGNIFAFNPTLWVGTLRYGFSEFKRYLSNEKEVERNKYVINIYKNQEEELNKMIEKNIQMYK
ncbi:hypothetical protein [Tenacibaculum finnmarkense]|uniref:hypothetical protein n=1 Tax=Tenacibaculum finnmarkense TaxID=2781243 RepID=UPI001EFC1563|nr:hypothetical protein [Tenacibaculum finnmarkense]MCG8796680.1 hypothetical protein [Tenacibaculum finnmarkense]MCG8799000.1 hypothetical protein [Tenacibaculum finnmarkense]